MTNWASQLKLIDMVQWSWGLLWTQVQQLALRLGGFASAFVSLLRSALLSHHSPTRAFSDAYFFTFVLSLLMAKLFLWTSANTVYS
jgi:hypothetical protein